MPAAAPLTPPTAAPCPARLVDWGPQAVNRSKAIIRAAALMLEWGVTIFFLSPQLCGQWSCAWLNMTVKALVACPVKASTKPSEPGSGHAGTVNWVGLMAQCLEQ